MSGIPTDKSIERHRRESVAIATAVAEFWAGLIPALKATGAKIKRSMEKQEIVISETEKVTIDNARSNYVTINGETISLDITDQRRGGAGRFYATGWNGTIQVTHRVYRRPNTVWKTRKAGWPFETIAAYLVEEANRAIESRKASEKREAERVALQESAEWKRFETQAHALGIYPCADGVEVKLDLGKISFRAAQAVLEALGRVEAIEAGNHERHSEVVELARSGQGIKAIKLYRDLYATSILDAKNAVEAMRAQS